MNTTTVTARLSIPNAEHLFDQVFANHRAARDVLTPNSRSGVVAICGAGPSLRAADIGETEIWACNSALPYLWDRGVAVTHGITVDQGEAMLAAHEFGRLLPVTYYLASSVHPALAARLRLAGRTIAWFHNFLGVEAPADYVSRPCAPGEKDASYEEWLYRKLYPTTICVGAGLNTVSRAVSLALAMGYRDIRVYGADCACAPDSPSPSADRGTPDYAAWLRTLVMYADGRTAACYGDDEAMTQHIVEGRRWHSRPDMVVSAMQLLDLQRLYPGHITYLGDTYVNAIAGQSSEFWADMPRMNNATASIEGFGRGIPSEAAA